MEKGWNGIGMLTELEGRMDELCRQTWLWVMMLIWFVAWTALPSTSLGGLCSNYRVEIGTVGIKNLEDLANRNSSVTVRTLIH